MITETEARELAQHYAATEDGQRLLNRGRVIQKLVLLSFPQGWILGVENEQYPDDAPRLGDAVHIVEADQGILLRFPPALPLPAILGNYQSYREKATSLARVTDLPRNPGQEGAS